MRCQKLCGFIFLATAISTRAQSPCELPERWRGGWFQSGAQDVVSITRSHISSKGECIQTIVDKFIFRDKSKECSKCVVISEKHTNILQYKESLCELYQDGEMLCRQIPGDALLFSLFRRDVDPIPCPLQGSLTFSYNKGSGHCSVPLSTIDSCASNSRILFKYQACPDVEKSESSEENVECIGDWREGSTRYFVGKLHSRRITSDEDRYRCFAWEKSHGRKRANVDYYMALSGDATCNGVTSANDGSRTLRINKTENRKRCKLPKWITHQRKWFSLDKRTIFNISHNDSTITISDNIIDRDKETQSRNLDNPTTLTCANILERKKDKVTFVAYSKTGCVSGFICTVLHKRADNIVEIQQGSRSVRQKDACSTQFFAPLSSPHATLTTNIPVLQSCPLEGAWTVVDSQCEESITHLRAACDSTKSIEFISKCDSNNVHKKFKCYGNWKEGEITYIIVSPIGEEFIRMCLVSRQISKSYANDGIVKFTADGKYLVNENETFSISVHAQSCPRQLVLPAATLSVNLTSHKTCADFELSASNLYKLNQLLLISSFLTSTMLWLDLR